MYLGYVLAHEGSSDTILDFTYLLKLLTQYAEWCRVSAALIDVHPPTVVQLLWVMSHQFRYGPGKHQSSAGRFSLSSSVAAGKGDGREDIREERIKNLEAVWSHKLLYPTPVQREHANSDSIKVVDPSAELFGTPWGHCGESISFASYVHFSEACLMPLTLAQDV